MTSEVATFVAKRLVGDRVGNYFKQDDPYFEATDDTPGGRKGKPRKKGIPPGLSERDAKVLKKVRRRAYRMDRSLTCCCCGFRFGWSAVIGIIPVIGDVLNLLIALSLIRTCMEVELPKYIIGQMYTNLIIDFGVGLIPLLGDFADAWFKCNTRNNILLERYLRERAAKDPAPPPVPKQSTMQRWFGPGSNAPESHPQQPIPLGPTDSPAVPAVAPVVADLPARHEAPATSWSALGDLEAQSDNEVIHYRREG